MVIRRVSLNITSVRLTTSVTEDVYSKEIGLEVKEFGLNKTLEKLMMISQFINGNIRWSVYVTNTKFLQ